jgi:hypothetical protein
MITTQHMSEKYLFQIRVNGVYRSFNTICNLRQRRIVTHHGIVNDLLASYNIQAELGLSRRPDVWKIGVKAG